MAANDKCGGCYFFAPILGDYTSPIAPNQAPQSTSS